MAQVLTTRGDGSGSGYGDGDGYGGGDGGYGYGYGDIPGFLRWSVLVARITQLFLRGHNDARQA